MTFRLVLGTHNAKKLREMKMFLSDLDIELTSLAEVSNPIQVEETGTTFRENAELKATEQAIHLDQWVLGEDSGLSVNALDGAPGIYSARFSGEDATDESNNLLLLEKLKGVKREDRVAYYTSHMALSDPTGNIHINCEGHCYGIIREEPSGSGGFGYDPLFEIEQYGMTFGELGDEVKSELSHRAKANRQFLPKFISLLSQKSQG